MQDVESVEFLLRPSQLTELFDGCSNAVKGRAVALQNEVIGMMQAHSANSKSNKSPSANQPLNARIPLLALYQASHRRDAVIQKNSKF